MFTLLDFLLGGVAPMVAAALAFGVVWRLAHRPTAAWTAAIVVGYAAGFVALAANQVGVGGAFSKLLQPADAASWTPVVATLGFAVMALSLDAGGRIGGALAMVLGGLIPLKLLWGGKYLPTAAVRATGFATSAWSAAQAIVILAAIALATGVAWFAWQRQDSREAPRLRSLLLVGATTACALTAALTGSFAFAQIFGVLAAAIGGATAAAWGLKVSAGPEAAAGPILLTLGSLLVLAACNSDMLVWQAAVLATTATAAVGWFPKPNAILRTSLVVVGAAVVLGVAIADFLATQTEQSSSDGYYGAEAAPHSIQPPPSTRFPA